MAINYPTSLDDDTSLYTVVDNTNDVLAAHHNILRDAVKALESKVGVDSSSANTTIDYFLKHASGAYRNHTHDGSSDDGVILAQNNGLISANETFTYASSITIAVASGAGGKYQRGDILVFTQHSSVKYFFIIGVADTLLTVKGNGAVVVEDTATYPITSNYYSHQASPVGFPGWFDWTPEYTGFSSPPTSNYAKFRIDQVFCHVIYEQSGLGTSNQTYFTITGLPLAYSGTPANIEWPVTIANAGSLVTTPGVLSFEAAGTTLTAYKDLAKNGWTNSAAKGIYHFEIKYPY